MSESIFRENLFEGKKVFITGGATGMGLGFAKAFLEHGADVLIASRKEENLSKAASEIKDQTGKKYYIIKNSWGTSYNDCDGYFYASEAYVEYKTMDIMLHKDAVPKNIKKKLGIK